MRIAINGKVGSARIDPDDVVSMRYEVDWFHDRVLVITLSSGLTIAVDSPDNTQPLYRVENAIRAAMGPSVNIDAGLSSVYAVNAGEAARYAMAETRRMNKAEAERRSKERQAKEESDG